MNDTWALDDEQVARVRETAEILLCPPTSEMSPPGSLPDFGDLVQRAVRTLGREQSQLENALALLPAVITWDSLADYATKEPASFELLSLVVVGAYFMSPTVLTAIGMPSGARRPAPHDQAVNELSSGILDAVLARGCPVKTLPEVDGV